MTLSTPLPGHAPGLPAVTRRLLLSALPVTLAGPAALAAGGARAAAPDPLPGLLALRERRQREWLDAADAHGEETGEETAAWAAYRRTEEAIEETVATSPEGVAAQIAYMKGSYGDGLLNPDPSRPLTVDGVPVAFLDVILAGLRGIGQ